MRLHLIAFLALLLIFTPFSPALATCGGGGGGGVGGTAPGLSSTAAPMAYRVPWQVVGPDAGDPAAEATNISLLWFPTNANTANSSPLHTSRSLTLRMSDCLKPFLITPDHNAVKERFAVSGEAEVILVAPGGEALARIQGTNGAMSVIDVETMVNQQLDSATDEAKEALKTAKKLQKSGKTDEAVALYNTLVEDGCVAPKEAKKAGKALKKLGIVVSTEISSLELPDLSPRTTRKLERLMREGVEAEYARDFVAAQAAYEKARRVDPADPVPLRYLAELHRHHSGNWTLATEMFESVLAMHPDAISRAVALHGLGKMTIHAGDFNLGLDRFHQSIEAFPLPLTYRNLAVFWNSEKERDKAWEYTQKALELSPDDSYNQIFAATYLVELGRLDEALALAEKHEGLIEASYNLAAVHALAGHRAEALELLQRHFYGYEQTDAVRSKEMREARDDTVFASLHDDPEFVELTKLADVDPTSYHYDGAASGGR